MDCGADLGCVDFEALHWAACLECSLHYIERMGTLATGVNPRWRLCRENEPALFITRTSSTGNLNCDPDTVGTPLNMNDIFGCGNLGCYATGSDCDPLKLSGHNLCNALQAAADCNCARDATGSVVCSNSSGICNGGGYGHVLQYWALLNNKTYPTAWVCTGHSDGQHEAGDIVKSYPNQQGGVMCCKNECEKDADCGAGLLCRYNVCVECIRKDDGTYEGCKDGQVCNSSHKCV